MISFVEHIRKLTIEFISLFNFWSCDTSPSSSFKGRNTLIVFFLTIDVLIDVSRICLNVADLVIYIHIVLLPNGILNFSSQSFHFWSEFLTARLFCFSMSFVSSDLVSSYIHPISSIRPQKMIFWLNQKMFFGLSSMTSTCTETALLLPVRVGHEISTYHYHTIRGKSVNPGVGGWGHSDSSWV